MDEAEGESAVDVLPGITGAVGAGEAVGLAVGAVFSVNRAVPTATGAGAFGAVASVYLAVPTATGFFFFFFFFFLSKAGL